MNDTKQKKISKTKPKQHGIQYPRNYFVKQTYGETVELTYKDFKMMEGYRAEWDAPAMHKAKYGPGHLQNYNDTRAALSHCGYEAVDLPEDRPAEVIFQIPIRDYLRLLDLHDERNELWLAKDILPAVTKTKANDYWYERVNRMRASVKQAGNTVEAQRILEGQCDKWFFEVLHQTMNKGGVTKGSTYYDVWFWIIYRRAVTRATRSLLSIEIDSTPFGVIASIVWGEWQTFWDEYRNEHGSWEGKSNTFVSLDAVSYFYEDAIEFCYTDVNQAEFMKHANHVLSYFHRDNRKLFWLFVGWLTTNQIFEADCRQGRKISAKARREELMFDHTPYEWFAKILNDKAETVKWVLGTLRQVIKDYKPLTRMHTELERIKKASERHEINTGITVYTNKTLTSDTYEKKGYQGDKPWLQAPKGVTVTAEMVRQDLLFNHCLTAAEVEALSQEQFQATADRLNTAGKRNVATAETVKQAMLADPLTAEKIEAIPKWKLQAVANRANTAAKKAEYLWAGTREKKYSGARDDHKLWLAKTTGKATKKWKPKELRKMLQYGVEQALLDDPYNGLIDALEKEYRKWANSKKIDNLPVVPSYLVDRITVDESGCVVEDEASGDQDNTKVGLESEAEINWEIVKLEHDQFDEDLYGIENAPIANDDEDEEIENAVRK